jgi:hypothetical protein
MAYRKGALALAGRRQRRAKTLALGGIRLLTRQALAMALYDPLPSYRQKMSILDWFCRANYGHL